MQYLTRSFRDATREYGYGRAVHGHVPRFAAVCRAVDPNRRTRHLGETGPQLTGHMCCPHPVAASAPTRVSSQAPAADVASRSASARSTARRVLVSAPTDSDTRPLRTRTAASTGPSSATKSV